MLQLAVTAHVEVADEVVLADSSLLHGLIRLHSVPASLARIGEYRFRGCQSAGMPAVVQPVSRGAAHVRSATGQTRSFGDVGSMSGLPESGHGWAIYEYTPLD